MDLPQVRLSLLQSELSALESAIRAFDSMSFQVKGWCVTVSLAIAGLAASGHRGLLAIGVAAVLGFWLVDSQTRGVQRLFIDRSVLLRAALKTDGLEAFLDGTTSESSYGSPEIKLYKRDGSIIPDLAAYSRRVFHEAFLANTLGLYLFLFVSIGIEALVLR
jgi:hypothetical protein